MKIMMTQIKFAKVFVFAFAFAFLAFAFGFRPPEDASAHLCNLLQPQKRLRERLGVTVKGLVPWIGVYHLLKRPPPVPNHLSTIVLSEQHLRV